MTIADKHVLHNNANERSLKFDPTRSLFMPDVYYKIILLPSGNADFVGIHILAELVASKQIHNADDEVDFELHNCFAYFFEKFSIKKPRVQRTSARLEASGIVTRSFYNNIRVYNKRFSKELTLKLNNSQLGFLIAKEESILSESE